MVTTASAAYRIPARSAPRSTTTPRRVVPRSSGGLTRRVPGATIQPDQPRGEAECPTAGSRTKSGISSSSSNPASRVRWTRSNHDGSREVPPGTPHAAPPGRGCNTMRHMSTEYRATAQLSSEATVVQLVAGLVHVEHCGRTGSGGGLLGRPADGEVRDPGPRQRRASRRRRFRPDQPRRPVRPRGTGSAASTASSST